MNLRPELMPPALDEEKVKRLGAIASKLDGYNCPDPEELLRIFNREAGTRLELEDFQKIYASEDHEDWVRRALYRRSLSPCHDISREEMVEIVSRVIAGDADQDFYLELFLANCKHPSETDLIFWPSEVPELPQDREPTAEEIADLAMRGQA